MRYMQQKTIVEFQKKYDQQKKTIENINKTTCLLLWCYVTNCEYMQK